MMMMMIRITMILYLITINNKCRVTHTHNTTIVLERLLHIMITRKDMYIVGCVRLSREYVEGEQQEQKQQKPVYRTTMSST